MSVEQSLVLTEINAGVARLTLNRPQQYNALSSAMLAALHEALDSVAANGAVRVIIIAAAGRAFCAGHDLREIRAHDDEAWHRALFDRCSALMLRLQAISQPVIAEVQGVATAAGCQLVAACDLAVASVDARFATSGIGLGLFCSTPAVALRANLSAKHAAHLLFTGAFIDAAHAERIGGRSIA
jgi:enoyl-CoA hydratase/carnithine racemase